MTDSDLRIWGIVFSTVNFTNVRKTAYTANPNIGSAYIPDLYNYHRHKYFARISLLDATNKTRTEASEYQKFGLFK